jgi:hypothetical protein
MRCTGCVTRSQATVKSGSRQEADKGNDEMHRQAEPYKSRWTLAAAAAAACAATAGGVGNEDPISAAARRDAIARYEAVLDGDAGCVEALQQLALLCTAEGACRCPDCC